MWSTIFHFGERVRASGRWLRFGCLLDHAALATSELHFLCIYRKEKQDPNDCGTWGNAGVNLYHYVRLSPVTSAEPKLSTTTAFSHLSFNHAHITLSLQPLQPLHPILQSAPAFSDTWIRKTSASLCAHYRMQSPRTIAVQICWQMPGMRMTSGPFYAFSILTSSSFVLCRSSFYDASLDHNTAQNLRSDFWEMLPFAFDYSWIPPEIQLPETRSPSRYNIYIMRVVYRVDPDLPKQCIRH